MLIRKNDTWFGYHTHLFYYCSTISQFYVNKKAIEKQHLVWVSKVIQNRGSTVELLSGNPLLSAPYSYMNKSHSTFQYSTRWQRPDQILVSLPHTTPTWTMLGSTYHFTSRVLLYSAPVVVGVVIYWWMKYRSANLQIQSSSAF